MQSTMQLLEKAMQIEPNAAALCKRIGASRSALHVARGHGRLTPVIAGNLASLLGEDVTRWIAIAAMESAPETPSKKRLLESLNEWRRR